MPLKNFSVNFLLQFLFFGMMVTLFSCTATRIKTSKTVDTIAVRNNAPIEKISNKNGVITQPEKETVCLSPKCGDHSLSPTLLKKYSIILGVNESDLKNAKLYSLIEEWWNVPYKYAGNTKKGIDCSGFSCRVLNEVYDIQLTRGSKAMYNETSRVAKNDLQEGDLVFFRIRHGQVSHVGIYLANNMFVHASVKNGVTISSLNDPYYKKVFTSGGRWR